MSEGRLERREERREERSLRAVATIGRDGGVVRRSWRVRAWPMPREEGVTRAQAMVVVVDTENGGSLEVVVAN